MISIIVAVAKNNVIGCKNRLIWHISEDLKRFRHITTGHPVVMGRKTFESMDSKPLPNRVNVVITRDPLYGESLETGDSLFVVHSLEEAIARFPTTEEIFIIGGGEIYRQAMPLADKLYLTIIKVAADGDTYFPEVDLDKEWRMVWHEDHPAGDNTAIGYEFIDYIRAPKNK